MYLNLSNCSGFSNHRSGWNYAISSLRPLHSSSGIYVDGFIEKTFSWEISQYIEGKNPHKLPYKFPWIGFMHNPQNMPEWFDYYHSPQKILEQESFQESLKSCRALFVLSDYLKNWLMDKVKVPVYSFKHPTEYAGIWNPKKFLMSKKKNIVQLGYWLRKLDTIANIDTDYDKYWMPSNYECGALLLRQYYQNKGVDWFYQKALWKDVKVLDFLTNEKYDDFLSCSIVLLDLYDSSANNAIIECISRATPVMVNRIPAVVEYLGEDYPLYTDRYNGMPDTELIISTHFYLKHMNKEWLSGEYFLKEVYNAMV